MSDLKIVVDTSDLKELDNWMRKTGNTVVQVSAKTQSAQQSWNAHINTVKQGARDYKNLKSSMDPMFAASQRLIKVRETLRYAIENENLSNEEAIRLYRELRTVVVNNAKAQGQFGKTMSRNGVFVQQAGYQMGDFLVQVQSGTNAMVAFGQQATQMAGTLTMIGGKWIAIGSALGVAIPLLTAFGAMWLRSRKAQDKSTEAAKEQVDALKAVNDELKDFIDLRRQILAGTSSNTEILTKEFNDAGARIRELQEELVKLRKVGDGESFVEITAREKEILELQGKQLDISAKVTTEKERQAFATGEELKSTEDELLLAMAAKKVGEDSVAFVRVKAEIEKKAYERATKRRNIEEEIKKKLIAANNALVDFNAGVDAANIKSENLARVWGRIAALAGGALDRVDLQAEKAKGGIRFSNPAYSGTGKSGTRGGNANSITNPLGGNFTLGGNSTDTLFSGTGFGKPKKDYMGVWTPSGGSGGSGGSSGSASETQQEYLAKLQREAEMKLKIVGLTEKQARIEELRVDLTNRGFEVDEARIQQIAKTEEAVRKATEAESKREAQIESFKSTVASFVDSLVDGIDNIEESFKGMLRGILKEIWNKMVTDPVSTFASDFLGNIFSADGGGYTGAGSRTGGVDGRGGFPAILHPNETVVDHTRGQSMGGGTSVTQVFNINGNGDEYIMRKISQAAPSIAEATKASIVQDRRRGGQMKSVFRG